MNNALAKAGERKNCESFAIRLLMIWQLLTVNLIKKIPKFLHIN